MEVTMKGLKLKHMAWGTLATILSFSCIFSVHAGQQMPSAVKKVVMASPFSPLIMPMAHILEEGLLDKVSKKVELVTWNTPDQLRAMLTRGEVDFVSVPSNVAAIFYNKGVNLSLARVSIWGVFYLISNDPSVTSLSQLKGERILVPFRGDQPDLLFQVISQSQGLDPLKDFNIQYVSSPLDVTMSLLAGKVDNALMIEPAAAMALIKAEQKELKFTRVIDVQKEYASAVGNNRGIPNAGVAVLPAAKKKRAVVETFLKAYDQSVQWTNENPKEAAELAARHIQGVNAKAFENALKYTDFRSVSGKDAQRDLELMFSRFLEINPKSIGGNLPSQGFYQ
ncbi:MAG: ABC transporter substrate-binding protein [Deltaproteobacteria bacterium]|nr:MAG: ABC transporter substrate-binding protein [Deltaproteobacteria bacterium]